MSERRKRNRSKYVVNMKTIAVIAVAPMGKASFVYSYVQTRLMDQYNRK